MNMVTVPWGCHGISHTLKNQGVVPPRGMVGEHRPTPQELMDQTVLRRSTPFSVCGLLPFQLFFRTRPFRIFLVSRWKVSFCFYLHPVIFGETFGVVVGKESWVVGPIDDHPLLPGNVSNLPVLESTSSETILSMAGVGFSSPLTTS